MKLGFLTVGLSPLSLDEIIRWGASAGLETIEVACWPPDSRRNFNGTQLDVRQFSLARAAELTALSRKESLPISCLSYNDNTLAHAPDRRAANTEHLLRVIEAANMLGVDTVCAFVGRDETLPILDNIRLAGRVFRPILEYAREKGVRVAIENCPMPGWQFEGLVGNVAHSPEVWDRLFQEIPDENFGLNLDPSHLHWLDIDPARAAREYGPRIFYSHAKDMEIVPEERYRRGIMNPVNLGWRVSRVPGHGGIDFAAFIQGLREGGFDGVMSIELEDPDYLGSPEQVQAGILLSRDYLRPLLGG